MINFTPDRESNLFLGPYGCPQEVGCGFLQFKEPCTVQATPPPPTLHGETFVDTNMATMQPLPTRLDLSRTKGEVVSGPSSNRSDAYYPVEQSPTGRRLCDTVKIAQVMVYEFHTASESDPQRPLLHIS